jgi:glycosyltransferase involved in cell wall biosynthesis
VFQEKRIAVVVPSFNEARNIGRVIETMPPFVDSIVVVDDCSRDNMSDVVRMHQEKDPRVVLIRHEVNQGVGGAIATGYKWARDNGADVAVVMAGDGQMDPKDLPALLEPVTSGACDYSKANRLAYRNAFQEIPKVRLFGNSVLSFLTKIASGYWHIADSQTGYTAINRAALEVIDWDHMYKRYGQPNDLLVRLNVHGFRVVDVPQRPVYGVGEQSKLKVRKVVFKISWLLLKGFLWRLKEKYIIRDFHPLIFFYLLGALLSAASVALFVRLIALWIRDGHVPEITAMAFMMSSAVGLQCIFFAMWFDMDSNRRLRPQDR